MARVIHSHQPYSHAWPKKSHTVCRVEELWKSRAVMENVRRLDTAGWDFRKRRVKWQGDCHAVSNYSCNAWVSGHQVFKLPQGFGRWGWKEKQKREGRVRCMRVEWQVTLTLTWAPEWGIVCAPGNRSFSDVSCTVRASPPFLLGL